MTSGHDQPLTRRQLRELERARAEPHDSIDDDSLAADSLADDDVESRFAPATVSSPPEADLGDDDVLTTDPAPDLLPERTLTRRELRLLVEQQQAQDAEELADSTEADVASDEIPEPAAAVPAVLAVTPDAEVEPKLPESLIDLDNVVVEVKDTVAPPPEHWVEAEQSAEALDLSEPFDEILARGITAAGPATTTSALIMPEINSPTTGPVPITGEILVTGSIDLPRSLGSTGQHPNHFESSDVDKLLDGLDDATQVADVAPVKASRAVSSHASTRGVMAPPSKGGSTLPTALAITAGVLTLAVIGLFVVGIFFNAF